MINAWPLELNRLNNNIFKEQLNINIETWGNIYRKHASKIAGDITKLTGVKVTFPKNTNVFTAKSLLNYYRGAVNSSGKRRISKKELLETSYPHFRRMLIEMNNSIDEEDLYEDCI